MSLYFIVTPIFLETNDSCLIRQVDGIQVSGDYLFILDRKSRNLFSFNKKGKLAGKIGNMGRGPENTVISLTLPLIVKTTSFTFMPQIILNSIIQILMVNSSNPFRLMNKCIETAHLQYTDKGFLPGLWLFRSTNRG